MNDLAYILGVDKGAFEFWNFVYFLFPTEELKNALVYKCMGMKQIKIDRYLNERRIELLQSIIIDEDTFIMEYKKNKKSAMEKLVQQPLSEGKLSKLGNQPPSIIYNAYRSLPLGSGFMDVVMIL